MLLSALSRLVGVISQHGGYRGNPIPITSELDLGGNVCVDKGTSKWPSLHSKLASEVAFWHIASFRCGTEFGRYRGIADIGQACTDQARFMSTRPRSGGAG